jgi:hypothetical protein
MVMILGTALKSYLEKVLARVVRINRYGSTIRVRDVGRMELGSF